LVKEVKTMVLNVNKHTKMIYAPARDETPSVINEQPKYIILCPICKKRVIDVSELPERLIKLRYKCPHCRNIVITPLVSLNERVRMYK
jgi:hypothetical protein